MTEWQTRQLDEIPYKDDHGEILDNGQLWFFEAKTTNFKPTFMDEGLTIANCNPVILDSRGMAPKIFLGRGDYRIEIRKDRTYPYLLITHIYEPTFYKWEPIKTAPRDGTHILLSDGKACCSGSWYSNIRKRQVYVKTVKEGDIYKEVEEDDGYFTFDTSAIEYPQYWTKLPEPPNGVKE